jgi:hypothetical protein
MACQVATDDWRVAAGRESGEEDACYRPRLASDSRRFGVEQLDAFAHAAHHVLDAGPRAA